MLIQDRVASLREPFYDVGACIDAARVLANITGDPQTIDLANARLIAAAPDLYAACEALWEAWSDGEMGDWRGALDNALRLATAALAKARGEPTT